MKTKRKENYWYAIKDVLFQYKYTVHTTSDLSQIHILKNNNLLAVVGTVNQAIEWLANQQSKNLVKVKGA